jgi:hypothetical protein
MQIPPVPQTDPDAKWPNSCKGLITYSVPMCIPKKQAKKFIDCVKKV